VPIRIKNFSGRNSPRGENTERPRPFTLHQGEDNFPYQPSYQGRKPSTEEEFSALEADAEMLFRE
jgi:hypothetical protein